MRAFTLPIQNFMMDKTRKFTKAKNIIDLGNQAIPISAGIRYYLNQTKEAFMRNDMGIWRWLALVIGVLYLSEIISWPETLILGIIAVPLAAGDHFRNLANGLFSGEGRKNRNKSIKGGIQ